MTSRLFFKYGERTKEFTKMSVFIFNCWFLFEVFFILQFLLVGAQLEVHRAVFCELYGVTENKFKSVMYNESTLLYYLSSPKVIIF